MTSTPVTSDVGSILINLTAQPAKNGKAGENFSDVLHKQTRSEGVRKPEPKAKAKGVKVDEHRVKQMKESAKTDETMDATLGEESLALNEAKELAEQMFQSLASELGLSAEELEEVLAQLGMTMMDLLQPNNLMQVFVMNGGANDAVSLLTNEDLYASFMKLNEQLTVGIEEIAKLTGKEVGQIQDLLSQISQTNDDVSAQAMAEVVDEGISHAKGSTVEMNMVSETNANSVEEMTKVQNSTESQTQTGTKQEEAKEQGFLAKENPFMVTTQSNHQVEVISNGTTVYTEAAYSAETQMIMDQIMEFMKIQVGEGITRLEMQLQPESLGTVQVQIASKDGVITAQFAAQNEMVKNALESQMIQLRETFDAQGIKVEAIEVTVQSQAFDRNLHQGRGQNSGSQQEGKTSTRVRRLNLNDLEEGTEGVLNEADQLAAQMMEQNGNTVDYTV